MYDPAIFCDRKDGDSTELYLNDSATINELRNQILNWLDTLPKTEKKQDENLSITYEDSPEAIEYVCEEMTEKIKSQKNILAELLTALDSDKALQESISNLPSNIGLNIMGNTCRFLGGDSMNEFKNEGIYDLYLYHCNSFDESGYEDFEIELPLTDDGHLDTKALAESIDSVKLKKIK